MQSGGARRGALDRDATVNIPPAATRASVVTDSKTLAHYANSRDSGNQAGATVG
jgi:hypothetical protein